MKIKGLKFKIHPTFVILLLLCIALGMATRAFLVFSLVITHEMAHVFAARGFGVRVIGIELYPYGGTAVFEDAFEGKKIDETMIAIAGPAVNIVLFLIAQYLRWKGVWSGEWAYDFARLNFWLAAFNLIPVLPLDGGRIIRAMVSGTFGFVKTTKFLAIAGKWLGVSFVIIGFAMQALGFYMYEPGMFIILGVFFWIGSGKELKNARLVFLKHLCRKKENLLSKGFMRSNSITAYRDTLLNTVINEFCNDRYTLVNVLGKKDRIEKTLSETEIVQGMIDKGINNKLGQLYLDEKSSYHKIK